MPSDLATLVGLARDIKGSDGEQYQLSPLNLCDFAEVDKWLEKFVVQKVERAYADAPDKLRQEAVAAAYRVAEVISFASSEGVRLLNTPEGVTQLLWLSLRHNYQLSLDEVAKLVTADTLDGIKQALDEANRLSDPTGKTEGEKQAEATGSSG